MAKKATELPDNEKPKEEAADIVAELGDIGKKLSEALSTAWNSEERHKIQQDVAEGLNKLSAELSKTATNIRESDMGQKVESGVKQAREDIESGKVADDIRDGLLKALRGLGEAIDKMADSFTPYEEPPKE